MTSIPASRSARAMIFAPRSCPSRPGLATTTRILRLLTGGRLARARGLPADAPRGASRLQRAAAAQVGAERERREAEEGDPAHVEAGRREPGAVAGGRPAGARVAARAVAAPARAGAVVGGRRGDGDRALHERVRLAEVAEGAGLAEGVRAAAALLQDAGVEAAVGRRGGVPRRPGVAPSDRVANVDRGGARRELEVADRDAGGGGRGRDDLLLGLVDRGVVAQGLLGGS